MMRVARLACLILVAAPVLATPAAAQAPAVDQYTNQGSAGAGNPGSNPGNSGSSGGNPGNPGSNPGNPGNPGSNPGNPGSNPGHPGSNGGNPGSGGATQGSHPGTGGGSSATAPPTLRLAFGGASASLTDSIDTALRQGGIAPSSVATITKKSVERFLDSALAGQLSGDGAEAVGRAVAQLIVEPGAQSAAVLKALLGYAPDVGPATHAVFTRSGAPSGDYADFQKGVVEGSSDVPRAYAEMSSAKKSFVKAFDALGVPTVDDIETAAGKTALVAILVAGAEGNFGSKASADAKLVGGEVKPVSVTTEGGGATLTYLLLALVGVAVLWSVLGLRPRRLRRGR
jgi:hypothetical protein